MSLTEARRVFDVRCYQYAKNDLILEISQQCPLLRRIPNRLSCAFVSLMEKMSVGSQSELVVAFAKRFREEAISELLSPSESRWIEDYLQMIHNSSNLTSESKLIKSSTKDFDKRAFTKLVRNTLGLTVGAYKEKWPGNVLRYTKHIEGWEIDTFIDLGSSKYRLAYHHFVHAGTLRLKESISLFNWWGLGGQTYWRDVCQEDASQTVEALVEACARFIEASPMLLVGLTQVVNER